MQRGRFILSLLLIFSLKTTGQVQTGEVNPQRLVRNVLGEVHSARQLALHMERPGTQLAARLPLGAAVAEGALLVQLDDREAQGRRREASAVLKNWRSQLEYQQMQLARANKNHVQGAIPDAELDRMRALTVQLAAEVTRAKAALQILEIAVEKHRLLAPFSGVLQQATPHPGERIDPAIAVTVLLDNKTLTVQTELSPAEVWSLRSGVLELRQLSDTRRPLELRELAPGADPNTGMVTLDFHCCSGEVMAGEPMPLGVYRTHSGVGSDAVVLQN